MHDDTYLLKNYLQFRVDLLAFYEVLEYSEKSSICNQRRLDWIESGQGLKPGLPTKLIEKNC